MKPILPIAAIILMLLPLVACRTNEANYRAAYQRAKQKETQGLDSTIYTAIRREARPAEVIIDGDTIGMRREYVKVTPDEGTPNEALKKYSVVAAQFKQIFHARSMRDRLRDAGWPATFIVQTREPLYYVIPYTTDTITAARDASLRLAANPPFPLRDPFPWLLLRPR